MFENFETNLEEYFYNMTYHSLDTLRNENAEYKELYSKYLSIGEDLETFEIDDLKKLINSFIDACSEVNSYENEYLYKKGYCDCLKLFKYLENS